VSIIKHMFSQTFPPESMKDMRLYLEMSIGSNWSC